MREVEYTDSELWVKDELERLFWIEIAKRKARQSEGLFFQSLVDLRRQMEAFFKSKGSPFDEPLDDGVDMIFDAIQFQRDMHGDPDQIVLLKQAMDQFEMPVLGAVDRLSYAKGFRWADFSYETDLELLYGWWMALNSMTLRKKLGIDKGKFSSVGNSRFLPDDSNHGERVSTISILSCPVRMPRVVSAQPLLTYTTDEYDIRIDGNELKDRLALLIDLTKPLPPMRKIETAIVSAYGYARAARNWELLQAGIVPDEPFFSEKDSPKVNFLQMLTMPPEEHKLVKAQNSVVPLIRGLFCWDLINIDQVTEVAARNQTAKKLGCQYKSVDYALNKIIRPKIEEYQPSLLPWTA